MNNKNYPYVLLFGGRGDILIYFNIRMKGLFTRNSDFMTDESLHPQAMDRFSSAQWVYLPAVEHPPPSGSIQLLGSSAGGTSCDRGTGLKAI